MSMVHVRIKIYWIKFVFTITQQLFFSFIKKRIIGYTTIHIQQYFGILVLAYNLLSVNT